MTDSIQSFETITWREGAVVMIDQRFLPKEETYNEYRTVAGVADAIETMVIRGAPAIGCAAAYGVALAAHIAEGDASAVEQEVLKACDALAKTRPTAVNLFWAVERMKGVLAAARGETPDTLKARLLDEANAILPAGE